MLNHLLPLLRGWRWVWDIRTSAYTLTPGQKFNFIPRKKLSYPGFAVSAVVSCNNPYLSFVIEADDMTFGASAYVARTWLGFDEPNPNIVYCTLYDSMNHIYCITYGPTYWPSWKDYIEVYIQAAAYHPVTRVVFTADVTVFYSAFNYIEIENIDLFKEDLKEILGTKAESSAYMGVSL